MIAAVIPVKRLSQAKSRLSTRLSSRQRALLVTALLRRTIDVLHGVDAIDRIAVATEERDLVGTLTGVDWLPDRGGLNPSLAHAAVWASGLHATSVLMLPCDLPLLEPSDLLAILAFDSAGPSITIAPTQDGGTGAVLLSPPEVIPPQFGLDSFKRHIEEAQAIHIAIRTVLLPGFLRDLDTTKDLEYLHTHAPDLGCRST